MKHIEQYLCRGIEMLIPTEKNEYYTDLLKYEHPLQDIRLDNLQKSDFEEISMRIRRQFGSFRKKVEKIEKKKTITKRAFTISLILAGGIIGQTNPALGVTAVAAGVETKVVKLPERIFEGIAGELNRLCKHNLAFFLLDSQWQNYA